MVRGNRSRMVSIGMKMRELVPLLPSRPTFATTPTMSKLIPFSRIVEPTAGRPGNMFFSSSHPTTATRRRSALSWLLNQRPGSIGNVANLVVVGGHAEDLAVGGAVVADGANVFAIQHRRQCAHELRLIANRQIVFVGEVISLSGLRAALDGRNASGKHKHNVLSEGGELPFLAAAEAFSQAHQQAAANPRPTRCRTWSGTSAACAPRAWTATAGRCREAFACELVNNAPTPPGRSVGAPG